MADTVTLDPGTGGAVIATDDLGATGHVQLVKLVDGTNDGTGRIAGDAANGLDVDVTRVSGNVTVVNGGTFAVQADTELPSAAALADGAANPTAPAVGAFALLWNGSTWDRCPGGATNGLTANLKALNGTTIATNSGNKDAGTQRVVLATDQVQLTNALKVDGSAVTQPVSGTVTANLGTAAVTNAGTFAVQDSQRIADDAAFTVGTTPLSPVGYLADQASTDSVNEGDIGAARITLDRKQIVTVAPSADTEGLSFVMDIDLDETETAIKATAGKLYGWYIYNDGAAEVYVKIYNATVASVVVGTTVPDLTLPIPAGSAANVEFTNGIAFSTAITAAATTVVTTADATAPAANQVIANFFYQ